MTTDAARQRTQGEIPGGGNSEQAILHSQVSWLRSKINRISKARPATLLIVLRYCDVFDRYFELREQMELGPRSERETMELNVTHVENREREISKEEYDKTIHLTPPE